MTTKYIDLLIDTAFKKVFGSEPNNIELKRKWDRANILAYAKEQGRAEGEARGRAEGEAKGETKSMERVIVSGKRNGLTLDQLQAITGWEKDRITEVLKRNSLL